MSNYTLPSDCQKKFQATSNCIECGAGVDALVILGGIAFCPEDGQCGHQKACAVEAARCAQDLKQESALRSRLLARLRQLLAIQPV